MLGIIRLALLKRGTAIASQTRPIGRRSYATGGHGHDVNAKKSELPWIIGSVGFTVPAVAFLLSGSSDKSHGDHGAHSSKAAVHEAASTVKSATPNSSSEDKQTASNLASNASEKASEVTQAAKDKVKEAADTSKEKYDDTTSKFKEEAHEASTDENLKSKAENTYQSMKETTSGTADKAKETASDVTDRVKSTAKNVKDKATPDRPEEIPESERHPRHEAELRNIEDNKKSGPPDVSPAGSGAEATMRNPKSFNEQSGKQEGISNSTTFHSTFNDWRGKEISKKAEGVHDTAKIKGTVDPKREGS